MGVNKLVYCGETKFDISGLTLTQNDVRQGVQFINGAGEFLSGLLNPSGGGYPKVNQGTYTFTSDMTGNSSTTSSTYYRQIDHGLGEVPDIVIFYAPNNVSTTYSMLMAMRATWSAWRGSTYPCLCAYHGNSNSTVTMSNVTTSYGICALTSTYFRVKTYSSSTSYYWRAGTYNWIAIKF